MSGQTVVDLRIDSEFRALIPALSREEYEQLEANIKADGCRDPLVRWKETLIDGHNRYEICQKHGIDFETVEHEFADRNTAKIWILRNQFGRRNLSSSVRAMLANKLATLDHGGDRSKTENSALTQTDAAALFSVSSDLIQTARKVEESGTDELKQAVMADEISVSTAAEIATLPDDEQRAILKQSNKDVIEKAKAVKRTRKARKKKAKKAKKAAVPKDLPAASERWELIHGAIADAKVKSGFVDWIITDPPYPKEYLDVYDDLAEFASRVLKPGGSALVMIGQSYLPDIVAKLAKKLNYQWTLAYLTPGGQAVQLWERKVNTFWKPVLWFVKGKYAGDWIGDVCRSDTNDKRHHHWGQSESGMADIVDRFTMPGETICDPFVGGGTTGVVAVQMNRKFIGIDIDKAAIETARGRLGSI